MMLQQRIAVDHASLPPEVVASVIETPVMIQEEEQDERPVSAAEDDDDNE